MKRNLRKILGIFAGLLIVLGLRKVHSLASFDSSKASCPDVILWSSSESSKETKILVLPELEYPLKWEQKGGSIDDASCLNRTIIAGIVQIESQEDVLNALSFASKHNLKVSIAGQQHTMGGHTFVKNGLVLDMKSFKGMELIDNQVIRVQAGATWADVQKFLDKSQLAVKAMQSINIFTVGGTISANAHGIDHNPGPINSTIRKLKIMLPDGKVQTVSRSENSQLFKHVIGGYGLFGIILEAELDVIPNEVYEKSIAYLTYEDFTNYYLSNVHENPDVGLFFARLSIAPGKNYLKEVATHTYRKTEHSKIPPLNENFNNDNISLKRFIINFSKTGKVGKWLRWYLEKNHNTLDCITRNTAMSQPDEVCDVTRNSANYDSMAYLKNNLKDTDILQEYFIPFRNSATFIDQLRTVVIEEGANLLNVTIRIVRKDTDSVLPYATEDMFGFVLYFNHKLSEEDQVVLNRVTNRLIKDAFSLEGTYYLPYQLVYSKDDLERSYPNINSFFEEKKRVDPKELLSNQWYEKYSK